MNWGLARGVLAGAVAARVFPGAAVEIGRASGPAATLVHGRLTYDPLSPLVDDRTIYDLASLTKALAASAVASALAGLGRLPLDRPVAGVIGQWSGADRRKVTVADLLEHASGLPGHVPYFRSLTGREAIEAAICREPLAYPPRTRSIYSDPGFMLLGFALATAGGASLDRLFNTWRDAEVGASTEVRYVPPATWLDRIAPTEVGPTGDVCHGVVHDENAAALGGVAAHAGLFGTAAAVGTCARWWLQRIVPLARFLQKSTVPGSSRALGWDTMLPTSSCGTRLSARAFGHTGFTGTSLWIDPARDLYVAFLSNRVHPTREGDGIQAARRALHDAVVHDLEGA